MKCVYSSPTDYLEVTDCSNSLVPGNGQVPTPFCNVCPQFSETFVELTNRPNTVKAPCTECPDKYVAVVPARSTPAKKIVGTIRREGYTSKSVIVNPILEPRDSDWTVVVTTAPRAESTIDKCLLSIDRAGWNPVVFAEPDSIKPEGFSYHSNEVKLGAWHNWLKAVRWALTRTTARYILTVQDDSLFHPDSRSFVESVMWPSDNIGFISLYTASHYSANLSGDLKPYGVNRLITGSLWGACALVFPRDVLERIIYHPIAESWTGIPPSSLSNEEKIHIKKSKLENPHLIQNVDTAIGRILNSLQLEMYVVDPSPVHHIAIHSAIKHGSNTGKRNCGRCADHSLPLEGQVFPHKAGVPKRLGKSSEILKVLEKEIGYNIACETCLEYIKSLDSLVVYDLQDLVLNIYAQVPFPDEWRKKHIGRTRRLTRIEELIKPLIMV